MQTPPQRHAHFAPIQETPMLTRRPTVYMVDKLHVRRLVEAVENLAEWAEAISHTAVGITVESRLALQVAFPAVYGHEKRSRIVTPPPSDEVCFSPQPEPPKEDKIRDTRVGKFHRTEPMFGC